MTFPGTAVPWTFYLPAAGLLFGDGHTIDVGSELGGFLGAPNVRTTDRPFTFHDGATPGFDTDDTRLLTIPIRVIGQGGTDAAKQANARQRIQPLLTAWQLGRTGEIQLDTCLPGTPEAVMTYFGRPREIDHPRWLWTVGAIELDLHFHCTDPYAYGAAATVAAGGSPRTIANGGDVASRRSVLTLVGSGGTPVVTNTSDPNTGQIIWRAATSATTVLDVATQTATVAGVNVESALSIASGWFEIQPGNNSVTFTGATSLAATTRPAWRG